MLDAYRRFISEVRCSMECEEIPALDNEPMQTSGYSSYVQWYTEGPFAAYVRATGMAGETISVIEASQPAGDLSDPPINDLVLIRMITPDVPCEIDLGAGRFSARQGQGDFILVSPNTRSDIQMYAPHTVDLFSLPAKNCLDLLGDEQPATLDFGKLHAGPFRSDLLNAMCQRLVEAARMPDAVSRLFVDSASMTLLGELTTLAGLDGSARSRRNVCDWRIRRTMEQMNANLGDDLSIAELASSVDLSPSRYYALFQAATGLSPHSWKVRRRIERSCGLLTNHKRSITDIALTLGFSSSQHFATAFRAHKGVTPTVWRRERHGCY